MLNDSPEYKKRKQFFDQLLTIYGRKPCLEAMTDASVNVFRLHLAESNKPAKIIDELVTLAKQRNAEILYHDKKSLSRISKNSKQDQGVAIDLELNGFIHYQTYIEQGIPEKSRFLAVDNVTNPQNLGMIIRSVCASPLDGLILPKAGCAKLDSLVIKASAGTLFRTQILLCESLAQCLKEFKYLGTNIIGLDSNAEETLASLDSHGRNIFILGNESEGISEACASECNRSVKIPMRNNVESLNVAVAAGIIAFHYID
ncbi:TrmH family RNA methyltransferase [Teredinibacter haidensis]|uniref:TrmH family RNA methyltransferase n=1 Tax=Teredinibacter haidensis TaxID=2731755 RepID=UPI000948DFA0|nr:RNA methyltransferase [Teredinibacter haidensis]